MRGSKNQPLNLDSSVRLVIGVLSFNLTGRSIRRSWIRKLSNPGPSARLYFILPADQPDIDVHMDDVIRLDIPGVDRSVTGKYFLQNAWLRYAAQLPNYVHWVARMDDDAAVNAGTIERQLARLGMQPHSDRVVYGPHRNWYMWHPISMQAVCWDYSPRHWLEMLRRQHSASPPPPMPGIKIRPALTSECLRSGVRGPYPFAAGPFIAYSRSVIRVLASMIDDDEEYVLGPRRERPLVNIRTGYVAAPTHRSHPSRRIFMEEIYYAYLLFRELADKQNGSVMLVHEPMHEM